MGTYLSRYWMPDGFGMNKAERMGGAYHPYAPDTLADYEPVLTASCSEAVARAQEALVRLDNSRTLVDIEPLPRLLLRAEAVSSSRIEGLEMPASKLLEYEELHRHGKTAQACSPTAGFYWGEYLLKWIVPQPFSGKDASAVVAL